MPDQNRRSYDPLLSALFDQNERQHSQNSELLNDIRDTVQGLAVTRENHSGRITGLETWREKIVDPTLARFTNTEQQITGVARAGKIAAPAVYAATGAATVAWGPKLMALVLAAFTHSS